MKRNLFLLLLSFFFASGLSAQEAAPCPETQLADFAVRVTGREVAIKLFKGFFTEERGHPVFDEKLLSGPYKGESAVPEGSYSYRGWYGEGENKTGGLLYPDGRLVQRGYCK